jgi:hypothetical protein
VVRGRPARRTARDLGVGAVSRCEGGEARRNTFIKFGGEVLLGRVILLIGFWLADLAHDAIARLVQAAIIGLVIAMGLRAMGTA